jgi:diguanylate cyclase (GGDEF)-like protein
MLILFLYIEIDLFAILVLAIIMAYSPVRLLSPAQRIFQALLFFTMLAVLLDIATWLAAGTSIRSARIWDYIFNDLYWCAALFPCYIGMLYCLLQISEETFRKWKVIAAIPLFYGFFMIFLNHWTGWIFTILPDGSYRRGQFFLAVGGISYLHMGISAFLMLWQSLHVSYGERSKYRMLAFFMIFPFLGSLLQVLVYGVSTIWPSITLTILMCSLFIQNGNAATDSLTHLNNRGRFDAYAEWKWNSLGDSETFWLIIMDIDRFKRINDTFGHAEGDRALIRCAQALRSVMPKKGGFLARIGGDEFAVILCGVDEAFVTDFIRQAKSAVCSTFGQNSSGYQLCVSAGYAGTRGGEQRDFAKLFSAADEMMYRIKEAGAGRQESPAG